MKNTMILLAMLLTAFTAAANVDDDTIKVSRVMLGGDVSKVSIAGYANVSIVDDTINYLTTEHPLIGSGDDKRYTYTIHQHLRPIIYKQASFAVHQQLAGIAVAGLHRDALKTVSFRVAAHTVHGGYPEAPLLVAQQRLHVVVGQAQRVVGTEILVVFITVVAVQSAESCYPQLPSGIFFDALHTTVRQFLRHDQALLFVLVLVAVFFIFLLTSRQGDDARQKEEQ